MCIFAQVSDFSGNAAKAAIRLLSVVCPANETVCTDPLTGTPTCTVTGVCGLANVGLSMTGLNATGTNNPQSEPGTFLMYLQYTVSVQHTVRVVFTESASQHVLMSMHHEQSTVRDRLVVPQNTIPEHYSRACYFALQGRLEWPIRDLLLHSFFASMILWLLCMRAADMQTRHHSAPQAPSPLL